MLLFARNFLKHPRMLGSLIPSSRFLIEQILRQMDWSRAKVVVEYGPGVGTITTEILKRMGPDARLVVFETNPEFVRFLRESVRDSRLHIVHGSAGEIRNVLRKLGLGHADYVISGIPFSTMPEQVRSSILKATHSAVGDDGAFIVYQFSSKVKPYLERTFRQVDRGFEPLNILPAHLYYCTP
jgi:phospholipid N-methyltransferase